jgi:hypothetical protein
MIGYLGRGHAMRVMLTARQKSLKDNADAIRTTLKRVTELLGARAVEARGMKSTIGTATVPCCFIRAISRRVITMKPSC